MAPFRHPDFPVAPSEEGKPTSVRVDPSMLPPVHVFGYDVERESALGVLLGLSARKTALDLHAELVYALDEAIAEARYLIDEHNAWEATLDG